eukprot:4634039-Alexandrium_andersonii.AAC.1
MTVSEAARNSTKPSSTGCPEPFQTVPVPVGAHLEWLGGPGLSHRTALDAWPAHVAVLTQHADGL